MDVMVLERATSASERMCRAGLLAVKLGDLARATAFLQALESRGEPEHFRQLAEAFRGATR